MTPPTNTETPQHTSSIEVAVAVLTEKVTQVIGDHERRISALETANTNRGTRGAAIVAPFIATSAVALLIVDKINWR